MRLLNKSVRTVVLAGLIATTGTVFSGAATSVGASGLLGPCTTYVSVALGPLASPHTQEDAFTLKFTNPNKKSCVVDGYPTLMFTTYKSRPLEFKYSHTATGGYPLTKVPPANFVLKPQHSAYLLIAKMPCVGHQLLRAARVGVSVPWTDSSAVTPGTVFKTVRISTSGTPRFYTCKGPNAKVDNTVAFTPLEHSFAKTR